MTVDARALVHRVLAELFAIEPASAGADRTLDGLGLDSLDRAELALAVEDAVGARIDDDDLAVVRTVGDVIELVCRKLSARPVNSRDRAGRDLTAPPA